MGNTHSNRIEDNRRRQSNGSSIDSQVYGHVDERSQAVHIRNNSNGLRSSDIEIKTQSMAKSKFMNRKSKGENNLNNSNGAQDQDMESGQNPKSQHLSKLKYNVIIHTHTWYRDSHGLFDYEEDKKMTNDHFQLTNSNFLLKREKDTITYEEFKDFREMRVNQKCLQELQAEDFIKTTLTCLHKNNNFWIYHRNTIEDSEAEKSNPGEKLWLDMRHMGNDPDHNLIPGKGYKLELGDTIKFGRVRYKVIMMNNNDGQQDYMLTDRFQKVKHQQTLRDHGYDTGSIRSRRRKSSVSGYASGRTSRSPSPRGSIILSPQRASSIANIPRFQSQVTQFDAGVDNDARESSFYDNEHRVRSQESMSQDMGDSSDDDISSSDYTGSGDYNDNVSDNVSVREEELDGIEELQSVQQQDDQTAYNYYTQQTGLTGFTQDTAVVSPNRRQDSSSMILGRFNSVAPSNVAPIDLESDQPDFLSGDQYTQQNTLNNQRRGTDIPQTSVNIRDNTGLGRTGVFFTQNRQYGTQVNNRHGRQTSLVTAAGHEGIGNMIDIDNSIENRDNERNKRRKRKYKKNQKQKLKFQQQLEAKAKLAVEGKVCRICLGEENEGVDPLISPCACKGTMSHIHLECLREWLNSKRSMKEGESVKTYCWKALECELCKVRFPGQVFSDGTSVSDKIKLSQKHVKKLGKPIEILEYEKPESDFIVIESVTLQNIRIVHVISMKDRQYIRVGRGHDADIRVTDISVSRFHAKINMSENGEFFVEDNRSKFGTLIQIRKPFMLDKVRHNYIQMGRTRITIQIEEANKPNQSQGGASEFIKSVLCCKKSKKAPQTQKELSLELYPQEWNEEKEDPIADYNNTVVEQTRDDENMEKFQSSPDVVQNSQVLQVLPIVVAEDVDDIPSRINDLEPEEQKQQQYFGEEQQEESKQEGSIASGEGGVVDNAFSVLEDQTVRAIIEEHGLGSDHAQSRGNNNDDVIGSRRASLSMARPSVNDSGLLGNVQDQEQQINQIGQINTGCEKTTNKFLAFNQEERDEQSDLSGQLQNSAMNAGQKNEISVLDSSVQDNTMLMSQNPLNNSNFANFEESKHETTGKKINNNSLLDADLSISPIKEEDHGEPRSGNISEAEIMKDMPEQSQDEN